MEDYGSKKLYEICDPFKEKKRRAGGRPRLFNSPEELWDTFVAYCKWQDDNPWQNKSAASVRSENESVRQNVVVKQLPYTLRGFRAFASIAQEWTDFKSSYCTYDEMFSVVIKEIETVVQTQQINGAMVNEFNSNLVARLNNIAETSKVELTGKDGEDFKWPRLSAEDFEALKKINGLKG